MERRSFLRVSVVGAAAAAFGGTSWLNAFSAAAPGDGPYGPLLPADGNGLLLPQGFTGRVVAETGHRVGGPTDRRVVYLTEPDGGFYRFVPAAWPDLSAGTLEIMVGTPDQTSGPVTWAPVPDPAAADQPTRYQVAGSKPFDGGEGCYYAGGTCWFTTKGDNRVWAYDATTGTLALTYDDDTPLSGVDNVTGAANGDLFVAEDGDNMEICVITPDGVVAPFVRAEGHDDSEITGPAFSPDGTRLYFSSQRGTSGLPISGVTFEITGPFRR